MKDICDQRNIEAHAFCVATEDRRFADPLIIQIVETWRLRQDMVRAQQKLTLQIKAVLRRLNGGDRVEAEKQYTRIMKGEDSTAAMAVASLILAREPLEQQRKAYEKALEKLGKQVPIYPFTESIKGFGALALAKTVGECGDLSAYPSVSGVWKRAGLAVINGGRQRRVSGEAALEHGYNPERRSVFWNIADPLLKSQGKDENAGPYRRIYDRRKAYELTRVETAGHAHNRAMRYMTKELLKDLTLAWRKV
jgi:transposase